MDRQRQRQRWREGERERLIKESSRVTGAGEPEVCGGGPQAGHSGRHHCCRLESKESLEAEFLPFGESAIPSSERANGHAVLTRVNGDAGSRESANEVVIARTFGMVLPGCGCHGNASPFFIFLFPLPKLLIVIIWTVIKKDKERAM